MRGAFLNWVIIVVGIGAAVSYFIEKNWWHGMYWFCAAGIGYSVLRMQNL
jgi:hypothetical protein